MAPRNGIAAAQDAQARKTSGCLVATVVFVLAYGIFVVRYDHWGLALGWLPSTIVAATFGWISYCFPWIGDALAILLELVAAFLG
jgi:hypothetical protein